MIKIPVPGGVFLLRPLPTLLTFVMLAALLGLGTWQVERLQWKKSLIAAIDERTHQSPLDILALSDPATAEYRPVQATGLFAHDKEMYLASISQKGEGGYHVLTPLKLDDGRWLLVDRGWVPYDKKDPATRLDGRLFGPVTVEGLLRQPHRGWLQPANHPERNEWVTVDLTAMAQAAGVPEFMSNYLEAGPALNGGGYPVGGQTRLELPNNHLTYAVTWYGLALALLVIYGVSGYRQVT